MNIKKLIKNMLFVFVVISFVFLVYKEFSPRNESNAVNVANTLEDKTTVSDESVPSQVNRSEVEFTGQQSQQASSMQPEKKVRSSKVIAYYFHGIYRCSTCRTIEQYSHDSIHQYFSKELDDGTLEFMPLNVEEAENRHYIQDYQLFSRSLVLSLVTDGRELKWKNLTDVWKHVRDKEKFYQYVKDEVEKFLKET